MHSDDYAKVVSKGARLLSLLSINTTGADIGDDATSSQRIFNAYTDLEAHGYILEPKPEPFTLQPLQKCLQNLGVDDKMEDEGGKNVRVYHKHGKETVVNGERYPATLAYFSQIVNLAEGVLIAHSNCAPAHSSILVDQDPPVTTYPLLHHWSDVAYLQLLGQASEVQRQLLPLNLRFIIRYGVQNYSTISVIKHIVSEHRKKVGSERVGEEEEAVPPAWPGLSFAVDSEEGKALLGTPNGSGTVHLLAQHRGKLGNKRVGKVTIFYAKSEGELWKCPSVVFWLEDGDKEESGEVGEMGESGKI